MAEGVVCRGTEVSASLGSATTAAHPTQRGEPMATSGEKRWPPLGSTDGRPWGESGGR